MKMQYVFKPDDAYDFARSQGIEVKQKGDELFFKTCPYCKPTASKGNLRTFSINLSTGEHKCFRESCGVKGNMITLARDFGFSLGSELDEYIAPKKKYKQLKTPKEPIKPKSKAIEYLKSRGISEKVAQEYEITVQTDNQNVLVFPFYDDKGILRFVKYRKTDFDPKRDSNKEWCESGCQPILFGMKQCKDFNRLIVTEGQLDSLSVTEAGIDNAVSVPTGAKGFTWVPYCWDWMNRFEEIVVFGDFEKGHVTLLDDINQRFKKKISFIPAEYYKGCKDANEILQKYGRGAVREAVAHAEQVPVRKVIRLADVEKVNIYDIPKLKTGISQLDKLLCGGLPFGQVDIISGKRGDGKSTFASQILVNAMDQGYNVFAYSGELRNDLFKMWIDLQIAGRRNILQNDSIDGSPSYFITNDVSAQINRWYAEKAFLFDNSIVDMDEYTDLLEIIDQVIRQYGVKVILLDNLMTALDMEAVNGSDKYDRQGKFVNKLRKIALKYNVLILLVAHRRKNSFSVDTNDEVSGTADITNYAGVILGYDRDKDLGNDKRKLILSKSRLIGKLDLNGIILDYDERSKRIYGFKDDVDKRYGWEGKKDDFWNYDGITPFDLEV